MNGPLAGRGQPLVVLGLVLTGWVSARAVMWDAPTLPLAAAPPGPALPRALPALATASVADPLPAPAFGRVSPLAPPPHVRHPALALPPRAAAAAPLPPVRLVVGQQLLFMAALSDVPLPDSLARTIVASMPPAFATPRGKSGAESASRWSADGWLMLRPDGSGRTGLGAPATATYGASQAGAVVRYRLVPGSEHRPAAYLRGTAALNGSRQKEAALGLSARPFAGVPVVVAVEARITDDRFASRVRPVAMAITELPPFRLPAEARGEAYAQAGYAGGKGATAFVDGQVRADRQVARIGKAELRAGAGVWGGAQKDAARLDVGPSASLGVAVTDNASARASLDWRFRIAGNAAPASGPAFTLSAGF